MNFIKSLINVVVKFVAGPFINLARGTSQSKLELAINIGGAAARLTYAASFFVAVPAFLLFLAKAWLFAVLALMAFAAVATIFTMLLGAAAIGAVAASMADAEVEAPAAA